MNNVSSVNWHMATRVAAIPKLIEPHFNAVLKWWNLDDIIAPTAIKKALMPKQRLYSNAETP